MHAHRHLQSAPNPGSGSGHQAAEQAHQLVLANKEYGRSNNPELSLAARAQSRQRARLSLELILERQPNQAAALSLLGRVELDAGRYAEAEALFRKSLVIDPASSQGHTNLGYWALMTQDSALAERCFADALALDRQSAAAFCGVAHAKRQLGQYDAAYLHYRKLLELGLNWPSVYSGMLQCAEQLEIHSADGALARDAIQLLANDRLPHQNLSRFVSALLRQQYDLDNPNAEVFLDVAAGDDLLLLALERSLIVDPTVEELITLLRQTLLNKAVAENHLADGHQRLAMALGYYGARTGYALLVTDDESALVRRVNADLTTLLSAGATPEAMTGSVIISAMYGALFHQEFAAAFGRFTLGDWAPSLHSLLTLGYFQPAEHEAYKQNFPEKQAELALAPADIPHAWPTWTNLRPMTQRLLRDEFHQTLGVHLNHSDPVRVLLLGSGSGQRALEIAHYYSDVEVIAVDEELANLAEGAFRARQKGLENIVFWPYSLAQRFIADGHQAQFIELGQLPSARHPEPVAGLVDRALASGGLVHMNTGLMAGGRLDRQIQTLVRDQKLSPSAATIRRLRRLVLTNRNTADWQDILKAEDFYGMAGCRRRWFFPEDPKQIHGLLGYLGNEVEWRLVKARDADGQELATAPVQSQLTAERHGSSVQTLAGQALSLYFQKRR